MKQIKINLALLMAKKEIESYTELAEKSGIEYHKIINFKNQIYDSINKELLVDLCNYFKCEIGEMLELPKDGRA